MGGQEEETIKSSGFVLLTSICVSLEQAVPLAWVRLKLLLAKAEGRRISPGNFGGGMPSHFSSRRSNLQFLSHIFAATAINRAYLKLSFGCA